MPGSGSPSGAAGESLQMADTEQRRKRWLTPAVGTFLTLGVQLALTVTVFFFVGRWLDDQLATAPWGMIGGLILGIAGAMLKFFRTATELGRQADEEARRAREKQQ